MITKELYSSKSFEKILEKNNINTKFKKCDLFKDYATYHFELLNDKNLTEFQVYSVTFSVIVESESSCFFIGKNGKNLAFLLTFTNDLNKYGLKKTKETLGVIPKENMTFDFIKKPLENIVWYKFSPKEFLDEKGEQKIVKEFTANAKNAEERVILDKIWQEMQ